jgi:splicing factor 3A subunit 2
MLLNFWISTTLRRILQPLAAHNLRQHTQPDMDYQNRAGSKFGGGGVASQSATNADRRERLRKLALETIDLDKDPYFFKNHVGSFECRLCLTVHQNDGSYLAHTQGRKHQTNLARRAAKEEALGKRKDGEGLTGANSIQIKRNIIKIGRPGYKITKTRDPVTRQLGLFFQLQYPEIHQGVVPRFRIMGPYEQKVEDPPDKSYQYLLVAAEPYETCGFKIQNRELDKAEDRYWWWFDQDTKEFWIQITFKTEREEKYSGVPGLAPSGGKR